MKIVKLTGNDCGGFRAPKGHLDTQIFPECAGTETDRNIVTKTIKRREKGKKKSCDEGRCGICKEAQKTDPPPSGKMDTQLLERGKRRKKNGITYYTFNLKEHKLSQSDKE